MTSKRANNQAPFLLNAPIRVSKAHRHNRGAKPYNMSRREVRQEETRQSRIENAQQAQGEPNNNTQVNDNNLSNERKGVPNMKNNNNVYSQETSDNILSLANVNITVSLFDIVREYPDSVKAVICQIFDYCVKAKNPLLAFFNTLRSTVMGKYTFNTQTQKVDFTLDMSDIKGVGLKEVMNPQKVKYTPAAGAAREFINQWATKNLHKPTQQENTVNDKTQRNEHDEIQR